MKPEIWIKYAGYVLCFLLISFLGYWYATKPDAESIKIITNESFSKEKIIVTVSGEVKNPGEYSVDKGTRVYDCILKAGGITKNGDPETVEPDSVLFENCTIVVGKLTEYDTKGSIIYKDYSSDNPCNINTASKEMLQKLPGIGETIAEEIVNYRETVGNFKEKAHIQRVDGIGIKKYENIKDLITVEDQNR